MTMMSHRHRHRQEEGISVDLQHGGDACASSNHAQLSHLVHLHIVAGLDVDLALAFVGQLSLGALDWDGVADRHVVKVLGHVALRIDLDEQLEEAHVVVRCNWRVGPGYRSIIDRSGEVDVLANWQT